MILAVDAYRAAGPRTGVGRYLEHLLNAWSRWNVPFDSVRVFGPGTLDDLPRNGRFHVESLPSRGPGVWWQATRLRPRLSGVDVLFAPYTLPLGYRGRAVVSNLGIYEGIYAETFPGWRPRANSWHFAYSARRADAVIANSASAKLDLQRFYGVHEDKITIVWPGVDERFRPALPGEEELIAGAVERCLGEHAPYFLFVGKLSLRRNVPALMEAFAAVVRSRPELRLLLVGPNTTHLDLTADIERLGLEHSVRHIEHLDQDTLALLYRGARAFVLPTAHEGFSFTVLEALASGAPVLVLEHRSLSDGGLSDCVLAVRDAAPSTLTHGLERLADDDELCADLRYRGPRATASFTWDRCARETMGLLERVASKG
jgi:glycosyltransferase involved in cell wall biosynthesis